MGGIIDVAICFDAKGLYGGLALIASLRRHARKARPVRLFAITPSNSEELRCAASASKTASFEVVVLPVVNAYADVPIRENITAQADWAAIRDLWFRDPWIIHFAGGNKPWIASDPATPLDALWWKFATASPVAKNIKNDYLAARRAAATPYDKFRAASDDPAGEPQYRYWSGLNGPACGTPI